MAVCGRLQQHMTLMLHGWALLGCCGLCGAACACAMANASPDVLFLVRARKRGLLGGHVLQVCVLFVLLLVL